MGSVGADYRCPLCGRLDPHAYAADCFGYPTCSTCNTNTGHGDRARANGGLWHGDTPVAIRKRQLTAMRGRYRENRFYQLTLRERPLTIVAKFLVPKADYTCDFRH